jgi:riboflavin transporter FmnP
MVILSMFAAFSTILMWFNSPILPGAPYLKFEVSDVPLLIATIIYGPIGGVIALTVRTILYFLLHGGNIFGIFMNYIAALTFILTFSFLYKKANTIVASIFGTMAMTLVIIPLNIIIVPLEFGLSFEQVWALMLPVYIPFNLIKGALTSVVLIISWSIIRRYMGITGPNSLVFKD